MKIGKERGQVGAYWAALGFLEELREIRGPEGRIQLATQCGQHASSLDSDVCSEDEKIDISLGAYTVAAEVLLISAMSTLSNVI